MIVFIHDNTQVHSCYKEETREVLKTGNEIISAFLDVANNNDDWIVWCYTSLVDHLPIEGIKKELIHHRLMMSLNMDALSGIGEEIGYVASTPFAHKIDGISYPTWVMNSDLGCIHSSSLKDIKYENKHRDFSYFLTSFAYRAQASGLLCYHKPWLPSTASYKWDYKLRLKFIGQHFKKTWVVISAICEYRYHKRFSLIATIHALSRTTINYKIELKKVASKNIPAVRSMDVVIPTLGRSKFLYDVLCDLSNQTFLPNKVILIEQKFNDQKTTALDFLEQDWPFTIHHEFISKLGACNARNIGLDYATANYVFLADDDIRLDNDLIARSINCLETYQIDALTISCLQKGDVEHHNEIMQWHTFGSGCSVVRKHVIKDIKFDLAMEHGYGEDVDYGNQIRALGSDILYHPFIKITHLKAPVGGFRKTIALPWEPDNPKPSPTIMVNVLKHFTLPQLRAYKLILWLKFYNRQSIKNPITYFKSMQLRWKHSVLWARKLMNQHHND